ncbi:hypothetical protein ASPTUDRAFT_150817 [Aspergillus tubingensis CBS 134.48]|uniref:Kynurenine 3-monooxygenase n=1 Tax=Aspergillus tubingensis (strain CBS 134.48) TaxID=767770 RepID=A0A1L9MXY3_ASPTC|nr:hypothetical protein ASPTUDRAFT_150817 [Aspergillus tubingensis CBS 134.48]
MTTMAADGKIVIVGGGPVGSLAALYASHYHDNVEVYELRGDERLSPLGASPLLQKSINFTLSERGIRALEKSGRTDLLRAIMRTAIPMHGRMVHGRSVSGKLQQTFHQYDVHGNSLYSLDRKALNIALRQELDATPNVKMFFHHKLIRADMKTRKVWFEQREDPNTSPSTTTTPPPPKEVPFDFLIGADGAHSTTRQQIMRHTPLDYQQQYADTVWCELRIPPTEKTNSYRLPPNYLHIWPGGQYMFCAFPCPDQSFNCILFAPATCLDSLKSSPPSTLFDFFDTHFPGVCPDLISQTSLSQQFYQSPHLPLIGIKCSPHHYGSTAVIIGDAAHAMFPFYGQGLNAGMEDVRILFDLLDEHRVFSHGKLSNSNNKEHARAAALTEYSNQRVRDAHAIHDLSRRNYLELRGGVNSPVYKARKYVEEALQRYVPVLGWKTLYSRVSFSDQRYSEVVVKNQLQGWVLLLMSGLGVLLHVLVFGVIGGAVWGLKG